MLRYAEQYILEVVCILEQAKVLRLLKERAMCLQCLIARERRKAVLLPLLYGVGEHSHKVVDHIWIPYEPAAPRSHQQRVLPVTARDRESATPAPLFPQLPRALSM
eukprot:4135805-Pyramimonas_sp.AAC.1